VAAAYEAAVKSTFTGAHTLNLTGHIATMQEEKSLLEGIRETIRYYQTLKGSN
jgi:hypothetical protein